MNFLEKIRHYNIRRAMPRRGQTALLVIDMQCYFRHLAQPILSQVLSLIDTLRAAHLKIVFTRHGHHDPQQDGGMLATWWGDLILYGSPPWQLITELRPRANEPVIDKKRYSAFYDTELDAWLRHEGVEDLIISGVLTNCCCETTARDAFVRDYRVFFGADTTATVNAELHLASLQNLAFGFAYIVDSAELCRYFAMEQLN